MESIRTYLTKLIESKQSNLFIHKFQKLCGVKREDTSNNSKEGDYSLLASLIYVYFTLTSALGDEIFYLITVQIWFSFPLTYFIVLCFGLFGYLGQLCKDIFKLPRPQPTRLTKIVHLEKKYATEYGFPSTHTTSGMMMFAVLIALQKTGVTDISPEYWIFAALYLINIAASRIYMGVHSLVDIAGGLVVSWSVLAVVTIYYEQLAYYVFVHPHAYLVTILVTIAFVLYPKANPWSASYGTCAIFVGTFLGIQGSFWYANNYDPRIISMLMRSSYPHFDDYSVKELIIKLLSGAVITLVFHLVPKIVLSSVLSKLYLANYLTDSITVDRDGKKVPVKKLYIVEIPTKMASYISTSFATVIVVPLVWNHFKLIKLYNI